MSNPSVIEIIVGSSIVLNGFEIALPNGRPPLTITGDPASCAAERAGLCVIDAGGISSMLNFSKTGNFVPTNRHFSIPSGLSLSLKNLALVGGLLANDNGGSILLGNYSLLKTENCIFDSNSVGTRNTIATHVSYRCLLRRATCAGIPNTFNNVFGYGGAIFGSTNVVVILNNTTFTNCNSYDGNVCTDVFIYVSVCLRFHILQCRGERSSSLTATSRSTTLFL